MAKKKIELDDTEKAFLFTVELRGVGKDKDEAWENALEGFVADPGPTPDDRYIEEEK